MSVSSTSSHVTPSKTARDEEKTISDKLARKRVLDRKAQQAARSRTKWTIENLQHQVSQLNHALISETSRLQGLLEQSEEEVKRVRAENQALRMEAEYRYGSPGSLLGDTGFGTSSAVSFTAESPERPAAMPVSQSTTISPSSKLHECIPWNTGPTCVSDRIVQSYVATARMRVNTTSDLFLKSQPDMNALLSQERSTDSPGVSNVVSDILHAYQEIDTLPKKAACLYVMYKLLNWLIYRTKSTYDQIPTWLRPVPLQLQVEHPAWIDRIPWPSARIYLINHPSITFDDFASCYSSTFHLSWPYEHSHVFIPNHLSTHSDMTPEMVLKSWFPSHDGPETPSMTPGGANLNPVFEQHLRQLRNWSVSDVFRRRFPELSELIDSDSCSSSSG